MRAAFPAALLSQALRAAFSAAIRTAFPAALLSHARGHVKQLTALQIPHNNQKYSYGSYVGVPEKCFMREACFAYTRCIRKEKH